MKDDNKHFPDFLSLGRGKTLLVNDSNWLFFFSISKELSNSELCKFIIKDISGAISGANAVGRLKLLGQIKGNQDSELDFISAHFGEFSSSDQSKLHFDELAEILHRPALKIESEDWLFYFIFR
jgi:hypothetical protein